MKIDPISLLLDKNLKLDKKFYFISGNETTLIEKISDKILESFREQTNISLKNIGCIIFTGPFLPEIIFDLSLNEASE